MKLNAKRIEKELAVRDMSKADLARGMETSRSFISNVLTRGTCEPKTAGKIAKALNIDVEKIIMEG